MIRLVCGLGNPGRDYAAHRHNAGRMVLDTLPDVSAYSPKFKGLWTWYAPVRGQRIILFKPETFMNKSGESLRLCSDFFSVNPDEILVVHDELELPFGKVMIRNGGGLGGHNGLKSLALHLGSRDFMRLRIGIGRPSRGDVSAYVLSRFSRDEETELPSVFEEAVRLLISVLDTEKGP